MIRKFLAVIWMLFHGYEYLDNGRFIKFKDIYTDSKGFSHGNQEKIVVHSYWN